MKDVQKKKKSRSHNLDIYSFIRRFLQNIRRSQRPCLDQVRTMPDPRPDLNSINRVYQGLTQKGLL